MNCAGWAAAYVRKTKLPLKMLYLAAFAGAILSLAPGDPFLDRRGSVRADGPASTFSWPLSGSAQPDLPISSAYGPRLQAGNNFAYDYHQGIDLPAPVNTLVTAVTTGTVRIAGAHPAYQDGVVQLDHGNNLYSNYLHISATLVITNQQVVRGQPIARSGIGSGFPHLHFEIRQGSMLRQDAVNPLRYLPYTDTIRHTVAITQVLAASRSIWVRVTAPADEPDLNAVRVIVRSAATNQVLSDTSVDYEARNKTYQGNPAWLDDPDLDNISISPHPFGSNSSLYVIDLRFDHLAGSGPVVIEACALDLSAQAVCDTAAGVFPPNTRFLPRISR